jgi:Predicted acid phosphatase
MRAIIALAVAIAVGGLTATPAAATGWCRTGQLNILLTNDDGYQAPGIRALQTALTHAGHKVTMVAPLTNQSGTSAAINFTVVPVSNPEPGVWTVDATPATAVLLGVSAIFPANLHPHLVVSGINSGANIGSATPISGTVGATIAAITQMPQAFPAIAISTDLVDGSASNPSSPANLAHFDQVAGFTVRLVGQLIANSCSNAVGLLPARTAINVNYPPLAPADVEGVVTAVQARLPHFTVGFAPIGGGLYAPTFAGADPSQSGPNSDTVLFSAGYVTVVPIDGNYTAARGVAAKIDQAIDGLQP